ncbi:MAG TPA: hypothetical protein VLS91_02940 [Acidimicrobiales bacterium]|nr:hypothetical protein [Acidimicrobiales bacterium]
MSLADVSTFLENLEGVRRTSSRGQLLVWRYHGRLVARQIDSDHVVIRTDFDFRRSLLESDASTFSVPRRFEKHMMVVANLSRGDPVAIEDALDNAWQLQRGAD